VASSTGKFINPVGFDRTFSMKDRPCIAVFAPGYTGKTRFAVTAGEWAASRGTVPGWIICDRKTRQTVEATCTELGIDPPLMSKSDYISAGAALKLANSDDEETTKKVYTEAFNKITEDIIALASNDLVDPIIVDSGTELWEWIGYARLGRREGVKARYWGPAKRDWKDLFEAVKHKTVIITFWARSEFKDDKMTGKTMLDGPPHYSYTTTTIVRLRKEEKAKTDAEKYLLDVTESIDNKAVEFEEGLLTGESITFANLMAILRPED
jgi:hypothetical protein